jgi:hypothetical protein
MRKIVQTAAGVVALTLVLVPLARGEGQTRESYVAQVEPICQANRVANERIMNGAQKRINKDELKAAGNQFIRVSGSFGGLIGRLAKVPPPVGDEHRVERWLELMRLLKTRLRTVGRYFREGLKIKATHESILAERSGLSANNISIAFHFHYCHFTRVG